MSAPSKSSPLATPGTDPVGMSAKAGAELAKPATPAEAAEDTQSGQSQPSVSDEDEFSDVVVLDPLGAEEQHSVEEVKLEQQQFTTTSSSAPNNQPLHHQPMDPPPQYSQSSQQQTQHGQSWFSSSQLPAFLAAAAHQQSDDDGTSPPSASASAARLCGELRARMQPWAEFFRPAKFGLPPGLVAVGPRVKHNLRYFLSNYLCLFLVLLIYCILTSLLMLLSLLVLFGLFYSIYQRTQKGPVVISGHEVAPSLLYTLALAACIPLFYLANAGSVMYWVIGTGLFLMLAHAVFYASEEVPGQEFEVVTVVTA